MLLRLSKGMVAGSGMAVCPCYFLVRGVPMFKVKLGARLQENDWAEICRL